MDTESIVKSEGEFVLLQLPRGLLLFTREEFSRAMRRGESVVRNREKLPQEPKRKRVALS
jgi:hypothetical protein